MDCYLCGMPLPAEQAEKIERWMNGTATPEEEEWLTTPEADCPNGCWAKEEEAERQAKLGR